MARSEAGGERVELAAVTRVLIESEDEAGDRWTTVGVSPNIIDASFQALMDSIVTKLIRAGAPVKGRVTVAEWLKA